MHNLSLILIAHWLEPVLVCVSGVVWGMSYWPRPKRAPNAFCLWHCLLSNYREWGTNRKASPGWDIKNRCGGNDSLNEPTAEPDRAPSSSSSSNSRFPTLDSQLPAPPPFPPWASSSSHECIQLHSALSELANLFSSHNWLSALFYCGALFECTDGNSVFRGGWSIKDFPIACRFIF